MMTAAVMVPLLVHLNTSTIRVRLTRAVKNNCFEQVASTVFKICTIERLTNYQQIDKHFQISLVQKTSNDCTLLCNVLNYLTTKYYRTFVQVRDDEKIKLKLAK